MITVLVVLATEVGTDTQAVVTLWKTFGRLVEVEGAIPKLHGAAGYATSTVDSFACPTIESAVVEAWVDEGRLSNVDPMLGG